VADTGGSHERQEMIQEQQPSLEPQARIDRYWRLETQTTDTGATNDSHFVAKDHTRGAMNTKPAILEPRTTDTRATSNVEWSHERQILEPQAMLNGATGATGDTGATAGATSDNRYWRLPGATSNSNNHRSHKRRQIPEQLPEPQATTNGATNDI